MFYLIRMPWWLRMWFRGLVWRMPARGKVVHLTFDDGPHPEVTPFVLDELKKYGAKATFFCIGKNVQSYPLVYKRILHEGHRVGNHTQDHLNGWKTPDKKYLENVHQAAQSIDSSLFRPPYGRIGTLQASLLKAPPLSYKIIMWDVLSADFDAKLNADDCVRNVLRHVRDGSIVVFHDSEKAFGRLRGALPRVLQELSAKGYRLEAIS